MKRLSNDFLLEMFNMNNDSVWSPSADIYETERFIVVKLEAAGLNSNNVEITLSNDNLTLNIKGVRNETEETDDDKIEYHQMQIFYGMFEKDIDLPPTVSIDRENISAKYNDGMLIIKIPKANNGGKVSIKIQD